MTRRNGIDIGRRSAWHHLCFVAFGAASVLALQTPIRALLALSFHDDRYSHIPFVLLIGLLLIYLERRKIFDTARFSPQGLPLLLAGVIAYCFYLRTARLLNQNDRLCFAATALIAVWMAGFAFCYGGSCFKAALFPLLFLLLMIPIPSRVLDQIVVLLQRGSAAATYALFRVFGVPVFRSGMTFALPGINIEVAKECSGIRSATSLFLTTLLAAHIFLKSSWRKIFLCALTIPVAILKNAVRIVTLSSLGVYVDRSFLFGKLHHYGGLPFAVIALAMLAPVLLILQKSEANSRTTASWRWTP